MIEHNTEIEVFRSTLKKKIKQTNYSHFSFLYQAIVFSSPSLSG